MENIVVWISGILIFLALAGFGLLWYRCNKSDDTELPSWLDSENARNALSLLWFFLIIIVFFALFLLFVFMLI